MADNPNHGLPDRSELQWKAMFSATEIERQMAKRLLDAGLYQDDDTHPYLVDIRMDPSGDAAGNSSLGALVKEIVDNQPPEEPLDPPDFDEPDPPLVPTGGKTPEPEIAAPELGKSMQKLLRQDKPPEPPARPKFYVPPPPAPLSHDQLPLSPEDPMY
jgi:hypothetical protein